MSLSLSYDLTFWHLVSYMILVIYQYGSNHISGGAARVCYRKWRHRKRPLREVLACACTTGSRHGYRTWPKVTWPWRGSLGKVHACATGSCAVSTLVGPFYWKWRYQTFHFPYFFAFFFKPQRLKCNFTCFSSTWRYKTFHFPVLFSRPFSNRNVWNIS